MERKTGLEPAAACLEGRYSTIELLPHCFFEFCVPAFLFIKAGSKSVLESSALLALSYFRIVFFEFCVPAFLFIRQVVICTRELRSLSIELLPHCFFEFCVPAFLFIKAGSNLYSRAPLS